MYTEPDVILAPGTVRVHVALEPTHNALTSLFTLSLVERISGLDAWVEKTAASLSAEQASTNRILFEVFSEAFEPAESYPSFPDYLAVLAEKDPQDLQARALEDLHQRTGGAPAEGHPLENLESFLGRMQHRYPDQKVKRELYAQAYHLLADPPAMKAHTLAHLKAMWEQFLAPEWARRKPQLQEVVEAHQARRYAGLNAYQAIQKITGRDMRGNWHRALSRAQELLFLPSAHVGPYLVKFVAGPLVRIAFGARPPVGEGQRASELSRGDLLLHLRALADETRLRILELLVEHGELHAQEIITLLELSQSSASRHLSQLSATGYLVERKGEGKAKRYRLNPARFQETIEAIEGLIR
ncbi:MAG: metalloregulator ArsR/SmtB family transcription factor [Anaerolineales bacterium]|jgi:ArsR family transcriptional regulator